MDNSCSLGINGLVILITFGGVVGGGPAGELRWHRPCETGACVEVAARADVIMVRTTANPDGAILAMGRDEWREFLAGAKDGLFDEV
jgi:hypothetical protein